MANKIKFYRKTTTNINLSFPGVNLTGATILFTVKAEYDDDQADASALVKKDITSHVNPTEGETLINLTPEDTNVEPGKYKFDIKLQKSNGDVSLVSIGDCTIEEVVTLRG